MTWVTTSDGVKVAVHDLGGGGRPVLLAHGAGLHGLVWEPLARRLGAGFRCISLDLRGHGESGLPPDGDFDWHGFALDVLAVVEATGLERPYGMGHSSGGTALLLAEQARPGTFAALYCFEPAILPADPPLGRDPANWLAALARRRREVFSSRHEAYANFASKPPFAALDPAALRAYVDHGFEDVPEGGVRLRCRPESEALVYEMASAHDAFVRLPEVACPVTLACGAETDAFGPPALAAPAARLRRATTEVLPGVGHLGPLEDPDAVAASVLRAFAGRSEGTPPPPPPEPGGHGPAGT